MFFYKGIKAGTRRRRPGDHNRPFLSLTEVGEAGGLVLVILYRPWSICCRAGLEKALAAQEAQAEAWQKQTEAWQGQAAALTATVNQQQQLLLEATVKPEVSEPARDPEPPRRWWELWK